MRFAVADRLSVKQARATVLFALVLGIVFVTIQLFIDLNRERDAVRAQLEQHLQSHAGAAATAAFNLDTDLAEEVLKGVMEQERLSASVLNGDFDILAAIDRGPATALDHGYTSWFADYFFGNLSEVATPLYYDRNGELTNVGTLTASIDTNRIASVFFDRSMVTLTFGLLQALGFGLIVVFVSRINLTQPLLRVANDMFNIDPNNLGEKPVALPEGHRDDELGDLVQRINQTFQRLQVSMQEQAVADRALRESEERLRLAATAARTGIWDYDVATEDYWWSPEFPEILGYERDELPMRADTWDRLVHPADLPHAQDAVRRHLQGESEVFDADYRMRAKDGSWVWIRGRAQVQRDRKGEPVKLLGTMSDITERKNFEDALQRAANTDSLTRLANRNAIERRIDQAIVSAAGAKVALINVDLERFKLIKSTFGHTIGDEALLALVARLSPLMQPNETLARMGSDEFGVLVEGLRTFDEIAATAERLVAAMSQPLRVGGRELMLSAHAGISVHPDDAGTAREMMRHADTASREAIATKAERRYAFFNLSMNERIASRLNLENQIREALVREQFELFYQPKVDATHLETIGFEALLRWKHPIRGYVSPGEFIPVTEETGLIRVLGDWALEAACAQARSWSEAHGSTLPISVNVSPQQLIDAGFPNRVQNLMERFGLGAEQLELEITEYAFMQDVDHVLPILKKLRDVGVTLSLDDFGTGYSSLSYLKRLPFSILKIDRSFVRDLPDDQEDAAITMAIVSMSRRLGLRIVAEGAESEEQMQFLKRIGCDAIQGFFISRPRPATEIAARYLRPHSNVTPLAPRLQQPR